MTKQSKFKIKAQTIHGSIYNYDNVEYTSIDDKVEIVCRHHGSFWQTPRNHLYKKCGCNACAVDRSKKTNTKTTEAFILEAEKVHGTKYDYSNVEYRNAYSKVSIGCPVHGSFDQRPSSHTSGLGCKKCAVRFSQQDFLKKASDVHGDRYQYEQVLYETGKTKIKIICDKHGEFFQRAESHLIGIGCPLCGFSNRPTTSRGEKEIADVIRDLGVSVELGSYSIIPPKEIDIFIPEKNIAIEFDGIRWHSELLNKSKNYHLDKTLACNKQGIRLIHIFENEWTNQQELVISRLKSILGKSTTIYARKCNIQEITPAAARTFLDINHIQRFAPGRVYVGLFYKAELVALMTFGRSRFNKKVEWELIRYCNKMGTSVVGGASKLFKWFNNTHSPSSIISYSDKRWNTGNLYNVLGFVYSHSSNPNYFYFLNSKATTLLPRQHFQKHKLQSKLNVFDSTKTEWENMVVNGYNRIWDCGSDVWIWQK